ncbi:MAG: hypothetical protein JWR26_2390 [Pedosphaera sp.]|nr:hypothetical protein [Pedosphaera sp.]
MLRDDLIGSWKQKRGGSVMHLRADGTALCEGHTKTGEIIRESATWTYLGPQQWNLSFTSEDGAIEITEYKVVSSAPGRMELAAFDFELPVVYERI